MKAIKNTLAIFLMGSAAAMAAPASDASIRQLMEVAQIQKLVGNLQNQTASLLNNSIQQMLKDKAPNAKQQEAIARMTSRMAEHTRKQLAWEKLEPTYLRLYQETFSEEEIVGMLTFYKTPAGKAVLNKMPVLMQALMQEIQRMSMEGAQQVQEIQQDFIADMKAASE